MRILKPTYKVVRGIIIALVMLFVIVYGSLYILLSIPSFQQRLKKIACEETSALLGGKVDIDGLTVNPFSEVILNGVSLASPEGEKCITIGKIAAGIDLWSLITKRKIILNYAEILKLNVNVEQKQEHGPLNIQFLIDALFPKDKKKPSAKFDLKIRNIVIRDSKARILRSWMRDAEGKLKPYADINLERLRIDLSMPVLRNDLFSFDIRNLQFKVSPGFSLRGLSGDITFAKDTTAGGADRISIKDLNISFPNSNLAIGDMELRRDSINDIHANVEGVVTPSDFSEIVPALSHFDLPWDIEADGRIQTDEIALNNLELSSHDLSSFVKMNGGISNYHKKENINIDINELRGEFGSSLLTSLSSSIPGMSETAKRILKGAGSVRIDMNAFLKDGENVETKGTIDTDNGLLEFDAAARSIQTRRPAIKISAAARDINLGKYLATDILGQASFELDADITGIDRHAEGTVVLESDGFELMHNKITALELTLDKTKEEVDLTLQTVGNGMKMALDGFLSMAGKNSELEADLEMEGFNPSDLGVKGKMADFTVSTRLRANTKGNNADNIRGNLKLSNLTLTKPEGERLKLNELYINIDSIGREETEGKYLAERKLTIKSDWIDGEISGIMLPGKIAEEMKRMFSSVMPSLLTTSPFLSEGNAGQNDFRFDFKIKGETAPYNFFNLPVKPLVETPVKGYMNSRDGKLQLDLHTPHLLQGKNKLVRDVKLSLSLDSRLKMANMNVGGIYPTKKGDAQLDADVYAADDKMRINLGVNPTLEAKVKGSILLNSIFSKIYDPMNPAGEMSVHVDVLPSTFMVSDKEWEIADSKIDYSGKKISVSNFQISHDDQYIKIDGTASERASDKIKVKLKDIDLEYIFNLLNINYVQFGGMATGEVEGSKLLTKRPEAHTRYLHVKNLSYNAAVLGDGDLASDYDAEQQKVGIYAVIREPLTKKFRASVDGGIWVTRDSLSFNMGADRLNVGLMKPFVSAFCSELNGTASGRCKLYGTFSDIDLVGALQADTLSMKLDFTNTWYHAGKDSVYLHTGVIEIPPLTIYDDEGHTAEFSGWLRHRYFHEPVFNFKLRDARSLLCYNTNEKMNPLWYGTIYGSGQAQINGNPGLIDIEVNMTTEDNSKFYYVINDAEDVQSYTFLSFTDRRKEEREAMAKDTVPSYLNRFIKKKQEEESFSSNVMVSIKGTVNNNALVTLVMDPKAGDNITARGQGALQMNYNLANNDLRMIGSYILDEGNYSFSLQDIILRNFNIRKGSEITFDGDPMNANLDITATYRVNTNLTDLDKSFSTDRELNRTNVPVDALLMVKGQMTNPDITFDIELPSLTSDVERKVKSIISTNDMMNRQIIYLLGLNKFYTPEYTESGGATGRSDWSSMASTTISSQLSNILSQMTDKLDMAPSFRSDKGDFTDLEFDLALSSRLLNNRLLINGNFGYRDRATSNTQFVGDFDIEYLLSKNGNLRLKAYNHFNDQNYYLRSALTTQGVGVVFRKDFDRLFRRKKNEESQDSVSVLRAKGASLQEITEKDSIK